MDLYNFEPSLCLLLTINPTETMTVANDLRAFGDNKITPSEDVLQCGHEVLDQLVRVILEKSKTPIARVAKNGSVGKKTAIRIKVDFDCMLFIDPVKLPMERYEEFLGDLQDILTLNFSSENMFVSNSAVTYFYKGYYFDFLPAPFAAEAGTNATVEQQLLYRIQHPLSSAGMDPYGDRCLGDQALAEGAVIFFKEQSAFVHCLARLLKWWSASVFVSGFFNGRSFRMEMFAVLAAQEERNEDALRGLRIALDKIRNYKSVHAVFERFYRKSSMPPGILGQRPLLLDPANPRNNLLSFDVHQYFDELAAFANVTLRRLDISERAGRLLGSEFAPQPDVWSRLLQKPISDSWIVGWTMMPDEKQPRIVAQKPYVKVKVLEVAAHVIGAVLAGQQRSPTQHDFQNAIDAILIGNRTNWGPTSRVFDDMDAIMIFPVEDAAGKCLLAGFNVEQTR